MKSNRKMPLEVSVRLRYQDKGAKICELLKRKNTIRKDQRYKKKGRPRLLSEKYNRRMIRASTLQNTEGSFIARRLKVAADIGPNIFDNTVRRSLI